MNIKFKKLNKTIINCNKCTRLTNFIKKISIEKIDFKTVVALKCLANLMYSKNKS